MNDGVMWGGLMAAVVVAGTFGSAASAQLPAPAQPAATPQFAAPAAPPVSTQPVPDQLELSKLIWSTMTAVSQANLSGNYSVLRDMAATGFQVNNDPARLAEIFAPLRASGVDLSNALLLAPSYSAAPAITRPGVMRVQGFFGLRPTAIAFDLSFQWLGGRWRLYEVSISPRSIAAVQPGSAPATTPPLLPPTRR